MIHRQDCQETLPRETMHHPHFVSHSRFYFRIHIAAGPAGFIMERLGRGDEY